MWRNRSDVSAGDDMRDGCLDPLSAAWSGGNTTKSNGSCTYSFGNRSLWLASVEGKEVATACYTHAATNMSRAGGYSSCLTQNDSQYVAGGWPLYADGQFAPKAALRTLSLPVASDSVYQPWWGGGANDSTARTHGVAATVLQYKDPAAACPIPACSCWPAACCLLPAACCLPVPLCA